MSDECALCERYAQKEMDRLREQIMGLECALRTVERPVVELIPDSLGEEYELQAFSNTWNRIRSGKR